MIIQASIVVADFDDPFLFLMISCYFIRSQEYFEVGHLVLGS